MATSGESLIAIGYQFAMLHSPMELRHLRYFVAVAEELSFTKAARNLRLAQPSLTRQVRNLEDELGVRLLDRASNRVALTEPGRRFLSDAKKVLVLCAESIAAAQRATPGESSRLHIGYVANTPSALLPATLGAFRKLYPGVVLNLFDLNVVEQLQALDSRRIDLGFMGLHPALSGHELQSESVAHGTMLVAIAAKDLLATKPKLRLADLAPQFFIGMSAESHPGAREWLLETCRAAGFVGRILQEAESEPAALRFVADGLGVAILPEGAAGVPHEGVVFRPLSPPLGRQTTMAWRADNSSKPLQDYIRLVKELSRSMSPPVQARGHSPHC